MDTLNLKSPSSYALDISIVGLFLPPPSPVWRSALGEKELVKPLPSPLPPDTNCTSNIDSILFSLEGPQRSAYLLSNEKLPLFIT